MKKVVSVSLTTIFISLLGLPLVSAQRGLNDILGNIWRNWILQAGNLSALGLSNETVIVGFSRLLLAILMFTIFFGVLITFGGNNGPFRFLNRNQSMVVSALISILAVVFLPVPLILAAGGAWATAVAAILIGGPIAGLAFLLWQIPGQGQEETRGTVFLKLFLCLTLFWILTVMSHHLSQGLTL
jgi:hypothetical protein